MLSLFKSRPLISATSADWLFDAFAWALEHFDRNEFFKRSRLIQPTNEFFAGNVDSVHAKAQNIFQHTLQYAGLKHWPFELQAPDQFSGLPAPQLQLDSLTRDSRPDSLPALGNQPPLYLSYNPQQTLKPEDLSASFAHLLAQHLVLQSQQMPPGGVDYFSESTEVVAIFMGFGVMFANSAYTFRGGCGSCGNPNANRQATLSEHEVLFALAIYCRLKDISTADATRHLKKHLRSSFKLALKQIAAQPEQLARLLL